MESATKGSLTKEQLALLMQEAFGQTVQDSRELTDGWANTAYAAALSDGTKVVLKAALADKSNLMRYERNMMATEVMGMRLFAESDSVPVPKVLVHDDSRRLVPFEYFVMEYLEGVPYNKIRSDLSEAERETIECQLGKINRRINDLQGPGFGTFRLAATSDKSWCDTFLGMMDDVLADGVDAGTPLPAAYPEVAAEIRKRSGALRDVTVPRLVHWDLWDGNVFVRDGQIIGVIDFERAFWGDPLMEFYFGRMACTPAFLRGYGKTLDSESERIRRGLYDLYFDLIARIECHYRQFSNKDHIKWAEDNLVQGWNRFLALP